MRVLIATAQRPLAAMTIASAISCSGEAVIDGGSTAGSGGEAGQGTTTNTTTSSGVGGVAGAGGGSGAGGQAVGGGSAECAGGFCRLLVISSCGDPDYTPSPTTACTTHGGEDGYCCLPNDPPAPGPCSADGGYCTKQANCQPGFIMTQMGCQLGGSLGSCCLPE